MKAWIWRWGPAISMMLLIFIASSIPSSQLPEYGSWDVFVKKGGHMVGYALLSAAYLRALSRGNAIVRFRYIVAACLLCLYSLFDEWHQQFTPGRSASILDVGIDIAGGMIGLALCFGNKKIFVKTRKSIRA